MNQKEFEEAIEELKSLWNRYKVVHQSSKERIYKQYVSKLKEISSKTHMETEDIVLYL